LLQLQILNTKHTKMKELENIISELVSINRRLANNFKTEEGKELRADLFDITQKLEHYKQDQALKLQQAGVKQSVFYSIVDNGSVLEDFRNKETAEWALEEYKRTGFPYATISETVA
jgi:hypothetical protein